MLPPSVVDVFEDAGHGFNKKQQQIEGYSKILKFIDKKLKWIDK